MAMAGEMGKRWEHDEDELMALGMTAWVEADPAGAEKWFRSASASDPAFQEILGDDDIQTAFFGAMAREDLPRARALYEDLGSDMVRKAPK